MVVSDQVVLCQAALIFAVARWILSFALKMLTSSTNLFSSSDSSPSSCCSDPSTLSSSAKLKIVRESLTLTKLEDIKHYNGLQERDNPSCAVCLNKLRKKSQVWELRNCSHVFHKHCLERWLCYDSKLTCPLCRASLVTIDSISGDKLPKQPSWAVENMLYLFGDDLLP